MLFIVSNNGMKWTKSRKVYRGLGSSICEIHEMGKQEIRTDVC